METVVTTSVVQARHYFTHEVGQDDQDVRIWRKWSMIEQEADEYVPPRMDVSNQAPKYGS
ncbi:MAG: hypothetical protein ACPGWR_08085 [Ardenticatenaceae bacterium]